MRKILMLSKENYLEWPSKTKISKEDIYYKKKYELWRKTIKRMFIFLGDVMRLHKETPVRKVLEQCFRPSSKKSRHPEILGTRTIPAKLANINILLNITNPASLLQMKNLALNNCSWSQLQLSKAEVQQKRSFMQ